MAQKKRKKNIRRKAVRKSPKKQERAKPRARPKKARKLTKVELLTRQVSSLQKRLNKYERQRFQGPLAPGQKRRKPSRTEIDAKRNQLKLFLEGVKGQLELQEIAAKYRSHENSDGSIDAELRVPLEDTGDVKGHFVDIEDAGNWNGLSEFWVMMGLNVSSEHETGSPTIDRRPNRSWTNPVRGYRSGAAFFTASNTVVDKLEEWGGEFTMIVIRIQWSPDNERLKRPDKGRGRARPATSIRKRKAKKKPINERLDEPEND